MALDSQTHQVNICPGWERRWPRGSPTACIRAGPRLCFPVQKGLRTYLCSSLVLCSLVGTGVNCGPITRSLPENWVCGLTQGYTQAKYLTTAVFGIPLHKAWSPGAPCCVCMCGLRSRHTKHVRESITTPLPPRHCCLSAGFLQASGNVFLCGSFPLQRLSDWATAWIEGLGVSVFFFPSLLSQPSHGIPMWSAGIEAAAFSWQENSPSRMQLLLPLLGHARLMSG